MENCIKDICSWVLSDKLKLNDNKTEFLIIGTSQQLAKVDISIAPCKRIHEGPGFRILASVFRISAFWMPDSSLRTLTAKTFVNTKRMYWSGEQLFLSDSRDWRGFKRRDRKLEIRTQWTKIKIHRNLDSLLSLDIAPLNSNQERNTYLY